METLNSMFRDLIFANECDSNPRAVLRFSDPDGVLSGKSGWSFGVSQFDTQNNGEALKCLAACGFTPSEISGVVRQTIDVKPLNAKLAANSDVIETYDVVQLSFCVNSALNCATSNGLPADNPGGILALADYINQYGSIGNQFIGFIKALGHPVMASDVLKFKLDHTKYGEDRPRDCQRRYNNLVKVVAASK